MVWTTDGVWRDVDESVAPADLDEPSSFVGATGRLICPIVAWPLLEGRLIMCDDRQSPPLSPVYYWYNIGLWGGSPALEPAFHDNEAP